MSAKVTVNAVQRTVRSKPLPVVNRPGMSGQRQIRNYYDFSKKTKAGRANRKATAQKIKAGRKKPTYRAGLSSSVKHHVSKASQLGTTLYR